MKLIKLEIEGITSIKNKTVINFESDLGNEDLFAITGPTGSGKSTILNCISLALFDNTHKGLAKDEYVTLGASKGKISLEFEINGDKFKSVWECSLVGTRGHKLATPKFFKEFYKNDEPLDTRMASPSSVIGLDMDQFHKTVIINQGQFSDFITSPFKDRKLLLEKIYSTENISGFPKFLNMETKKLTDQITQLKNRIEGGLPFDEDEYNKYKADIVNIRKDQKSVLNSKAYLESCFSALKEITVNAGQILSNKTAIEDLDVKIKKIDMDVTSANVKIKNAEIDLANKESTQKKQTPMIERGIKIKDIEREVEKELVKRNQQNEKLQQAISIESSELSKLQNNKNILTEEIKVKRSAIPVNILSDDLELIEKLFAEIHLFDQNALIHKTNLEKNMAEVQETEIDGNRYKVEIEQILTELSLISETSKPLNKKSILKLVEDKLDKTQLLRQQSLKDLQTFESTNANVLEFFKTISRKMEEVTLLKEKISGNEISLNSLKHELDMLQRNKELLEKERELHDLRSAINKCISKAKEDKECPVCGNVGLASINDFKNFDSNAENIQNDLSEVLSCIEKTQSKINNDNQNIVFRTNEINRITLEIKNLKNKTTEILLPFGVEEVEDEKHFKIKADNIIQRLSKKTEQEKSLYESISKQAGQLGICFNNLEHQRNKYSDLLRKQEESTRELHSLNKKVTDINELLSSKLQVKKESLESDGKSLLNDIKQKRDLETRLENIEALIEKQKRNVSNFEVQFKTINTEIKSLNEQKISSGEALKEIIDHLKTDDFLLLKENLENQIRVSRRIKDSILKETYEIQGERDKLINQRNLKQENNENLEGHVLRYLNLLQRRELPGSSSERLKDFDKRMEKISGLKSDKFEMWEIENIKGFMDDQLEPILHQTTDKACDLHEDIIRIETKMTSYEEKVSEFTKISSEIIKIEKDLKIKERLKEVIGRDEFTRFAISMIENQLIQMTNNELKQLCDGRYELFQQEKNKTSGPEFFIYDHWRGGAERPLPSLSGGETFMVSLAMALGLAEMSRGQTEIDTFFIDEGFGTLDQDSLEDVLNILMNIRSRGKQIGIISHVKELTERLPVRIQLQKDQMGESSIEVANC